MTYAATEIFYYWKDLPTETENSLRTVSLHISRQVANMSLLQSAWLNACLIKIKHPKETKFPGKRGEDDKVNAAGHSASAGGKSTRLRLKLAHVSVSAANEQGP